MGARATRELNVTPSIELYDIIFSQFNCVKKIQLTTSELNLILSTLKYEKDSKND